MIPPQTAPHRTVRHIVHRHRFLSRCLHALCSELSRTRQASRFNPACLAQSRATDVRVGRARSGEQLEPFQPGQGSGTRRGERRQRLEPVLPTWPARHPHQSPQAAVHAISKIRDTALKYANDPRWSQRGKYVVIHTGSRPESVSPWIRSATVVVGHNTDRSLRRSAGACCTNTEAKTERRVLLYIWLYSAEQTVGV